VTPLADCESRLGHRQQSAPFPVSYANFAFAVVVVALMCPILMQGKYTVHCTEVCMVTSRSRLHMGPKQ
jgi:hypothetical protein